MRATLICTSTTDGHSATVTLSGDLVYDGGDELLKAVDLLLTSHPIRVLTVDCEGLTYCDSHGLSMLLAAHRRATTAGASLRLAQRPAFLDRLLHRTNTHRHLTTATASREHQAD